MVILLLLTLLIVGWLTRPEIPIQITKKEIIIQRQLDTVFLNEIVVKWKEKEVEKLVVILDTIRDTTVIVKVQNEVITKLVEVSKDKDTIIVKLKKIDSLNKDVIVDLKKENIKIIKKKKRLGKAFKMTTTALGIFIVKEILKL